METQYRQLTETEAAVQGRLYMELETYKELKAIADDWFGEECVLLKAVFNYDTDEEGGYIGTADNIYGLDAKGNRLSLHMPQHILKTWAEEGKPVRQYNDDEEEDEDSVLLSDEWRDVLDESGYLLENHIWRREYVPTVIPLFVVKEEVPAEDAA